MKRVLPMVMILGVAAPVLAGFGDLVFTVPVGAGGLHYEGVGVAELEAWGPRAIAVGPDGVTWIVDGPAARIAGFDRTGREVASISTEGIATGILDIEVTQHGIFALDLAAVAPRVLEISFGGTLLLEHPLPAHLGLDHGVSGIRLGEHGELLVELESGAMVWELLDASGNALENPVPIAVSPRAGELLGRGGDRAAILLTESVTIDDTITVEQIVRRVDLAGHESASILPAQHLWVAHPVAVGSDGEAFALVTRPDRVEVYQLVWSDARPMPRPLLTVDDGPGSDVDGCVSSSTMESTAWSFRNNSKSLTNTNINGSCSGRTKPRYLGSPGTYGSVSYDWGGFDSVSGWNSYMSSGYKAGDINTAGVESCSKGVDCSGFVSRCWQLTTKYGTSTLPSISTLLSSTSQLKKGDILNKAGSHVVMVSSITGNGVYAWESTTGGYDRVIYNYNSWSRYSGYLPRRYVNKCP